MNDRLLFKPFQALLALPLLLHAPMLAAQTPVAPTPVVAEPFTPLAGRALCRGAEGYRIAGQHPRTIFWRPEWLAAAKASAAEGSAVTATLRARADAALGRASYSVTQKTSVPPGGATANDYYSIGPYWWPARGKPNGLPYERRDGQVNPESRDDTFDKNRIGKFSNDVTDLALAYHLFGDRRYAEKAAQHLRVWFLDPATRMNPSMRNAQAVPGRNAGRPEGIIELRALTPVVESIGLLESANVLTADEQAGLEAWFSELVQWMATDPIGRAERAKNNNHGIFFDALITHFALFARLDPVANHIAREWPARRLAIQFAANGSLPEELERTRSLHYSYFALEAAAQTATVAECMGVDLWRASAGEGKSLNAAFGFLTPYAANPQDWPHEEEALKTPSKMPNLQEQIGTSLRLMAWGTGAASYEAQADGKISASDVDYLWLPPLAAGTAR